MGGVSKSAKPPPSAEPDEGENDRPTVVPPFDVEEMARRSRASGPAATEPDVDEEMPTVIPPPGGEFRTQISTLVDEGELEGARIASMQQSSHPPLAGASARWSIAPGPRERPGEDPVIEIIGDGQSAEEEEEIDPLDEAQLLLDGGDEEGALAIVDVILRRTPSNAPARRIAEECERALAMKYAGQLGSLARIPKLAVSVDKLVSLSLDHRAGFLISFVDGVSALATIMDMSGMSPSEVLRTFVDLKSRGIITLR
jgi:hypothetical protein